MWGRRNDALYIYLEDQMGDDLVALLPVTGAMPFADWASAARAQGLRPDLWLRLKHNGTIRTFIDDATGVLMVARGEVQS